MNDISDIWADDKLGRREDAELIRRFIIAQLDIREKIGKPRTFVLNLDSQWGGGKTFFLTRFKQDLESKGHIVASVNAWEDDHSDDPLIAVVAAIKDSLAEHLPDKGRSEKLKPLAQNAGMIVTKSLQHFLKQYFRDRIGDEGVEAIAEMAAEQTIDAVGGNVLKSFEKQKNSVFNFRNDLEKLTSSVMLESDKNAPLFVLIDELDRCRPDYAIKLLERIKHLFSVENIVFVVATDTGQLSNAVSGAYGNDFDGKRYLKRFFDRSYHFADASKAEFIAATFDELGMNPNEFSVPLDQPVISFIEQLCNLPDIQLRDIKQMLERTQTFASIWPYPDIKINLAVLFPMLFQIHVHGYEELDAENHMYGVLISNPINYQYADNESRPPPEIVPLKSLIEKFNKHSTNLRSAGFLNDLGNPIQSGILLDDWTYEQLHLELATRINDGDLNDDNPNSALLEYPKLLQQLAKLDDTSRDEA